ncbi:MAG: NAD-dependent epimerase/dehydratase family protein [Chloroflexota bacterium]
MKALITGGAGFIGSTLANRLQATGHHVRVIDDLSAGDQERLHPAIHFTRGDVGDKPKLWGLLNGVDCVYHLAARVSVPESVLYPREYNATNVGGTVALMEAMRDAGVKRVVLASSGAIYGEHPHLKVNEDCAPKPTSPYAVSKLCAEHYVTTIGQLWGIETVMLRIFNAYGPGQPLPLSHPPVIPQVLQQMLWDGSVTIHGDGSQIRDFVYIDDVVSALVKAATAQNVDQTMINIGSGVGTAINEIVRLAEKVLHRKAQVLHVHSNNGGVSRLVSDLNLAQTLLDYKPQISLAEGLEKLVALDKRFSDSQVIV